MSNELTIGGRFARGPLAPMAPNPERTPRPEGSAAAIYRWFRSMPCLSLALLGLDPPEPMQALPAGPPLTPASKELDGPLLCAASLIGSMGPSVAWRPRSWNLARRAGTVALLAPGMG